MGFIASIKTNTCSQQVPRRKALTGQMSNQQLSLLLRQFLKLSFVITFRLSNRAKRYLPSSVSSRVQPEENPVKVR